MTHTPGPWETRRNHSQTSEGEAIFIQDTANRHVLAIVRHNWLEWEEYEANARLIASAPLLLDTLKKLRGSTIGGITPDLDTEACRYLWNMIDNAITQAEGKEISI